MFLLEYFKMEFRESQKFSQVWILLPFSLIGSVVIFIFGFGIYKQIICKIPFGNNPLSDHGLIITSLLILLLFVTLFLLFVSAHLEYRINEKGIEYRFFPFHMNSRRIQWSDIANFEIIKYNPLSDFGGWGIRYGKKSILYSVKGNKGLSISLKSGKNIIIGINKVSELEEYLENLKQIRSL